MNRHLSGVMVAVFAAAMLFPTPTFADHRPDNVMVMGGSLSLTGGGAGTLRPAISIPENLEFRHAEIDARADGEKSHKCGKTHIFAAWALAGSEG